MSGKSTYLRNGWLKLLFQATAIANVADNAASSPLTTLYLSLHTSDPGLAPATEQSQGETAYTGYARIGLTRSAVGWTVTGNDVTPAANVDFGECTASPGSAITYVGVGTLASGNGKLLMSGALSPSITMATGVIPRLTTASKITET